MVAWALDNVNCASATPTEDPTDGVNAATIFTVNAAGDYKLCYRASGLSDSVEQNGITLTVQAETLG